MSFQYGNQPKAAPNAGIVTFDELVKRVVYLERQLAELKASSPPRVASDSELNSERGNPEIKFDPKRWTGPSFKGKNMSDCPSAFLEMYADTKRWQASKNLEDAQKNPAEAEKLVKYAHFSEKDAERALGWAKRNEGKHIPEPSANEPAYVNNGDDLPF